MTRVGLVTLGLILLVLVFAAAALLVMRSERRYREQQARIDELQARVEASHGIDAIIARAREGLPQHPQSHRRRGHLRAVDGGAAAIVAGLVVAWAWVKAHRAAAVGIGATTAAAGLMVLPLLLGPDRGTERLDVAPPTSPPGRSPPPVEPTPSPTQEPEPGLPPADETPGESEPPPLFQPAPVRPPAGPPVVDRDPPPQPEPEPEPEPSPPPPTPAPEPPPTTTPPPEPEPEPPVDDPLLCLELDLDLLLPPVELCLL